MPDYYEVLQVHPRAESEVIRAAYRTLARKYHPDVEGGSSARMIALNDAWDVLGDPVRRAAYDAARNSSGGRQPSAASAWGAGRTQSAGPPGTTAGSTGGSTAGSTGGTTAGSTGGSSGSGASPSATTSEAPHAGPPPGRPSGTVLDFGRYTGWSLGEIARHDLDYLEWLQRATFGRRLRTEVDALVRQRRAATGGAPDGPTSQRWGNRR
jgi:curved DNA-binding protein CbpA